VRTTKLLWFRQDLRLADNPALTACLRDDGAMLPCYVLDQQAAGDWAWGGAHLWWLHHSLAALRDDLAHHQVSLRLHRGAAEQILPDLARAAGAHEVHAAAAYEPWARAQEQRVAATLRAHGIVLHLHGSRMLVDHDRIRPGGSYSVYSPFMRAVRAAGPPHAPLPAPGHIPPATGEGEALESWQLLPRQPDWAAGLRATWQPGELGATQRLHRFLAESAADYTVGRDRPGDDSTSLLSPHLHWGEISPRQLWHAAEAADLPDQSRTSFVNELLWREFAIHLLWHQPQLPDAPLRKSFDRMAWRDDPAGRRAWQRGQTGIPLVDAGMRQLWHSGWMHNRVRMITASFLIKHLLIDWRYGERWFWDTLVDGDLASNSVGWQWVAGCGADAAPFFRVFNPVLQGRKFDPDGAYVRRWVPELAGLSDRDIHAPWEATPLALSAAGIRLGVSYPNPVIDLAAGRDRALANFRQIGAMSP
jgi:deoxyribodipyrimidine photo-lyase